MRRPKQVEGDAGPDSGPTSVGDALAWNPRIPPGSRRDLGAPAWIFALLAGRRAGTGAPVLFRVLGRHRGLFRGWLHFAGRLMPGGLLPRRETELVILRVAHLRGCRYEFDHHVRLGARAGVTRADLDRIIEHGSEADGWSPRERAILAAVDALQAARDLDDAAWARLREHLDERESIELIMLVGHYDMLATAIIALRIPPDPPRRRRPAPGGPRT
ncbi:carboxymuconolactone decarboxylase family protein [Actinoallomurus purpureus]|uniref:carboxymuconolactone decarboxylase family protein n=1 Tax=Actinoallomurus purpureus TaxID=478114 RepID=UPI0020939492|nr:carboxymuconolactone decarboxylase family protein [Actinoallomurus purpureus]MCO6010369.1 carboxymuconolactone decarboxylase family protein [Actinoallomurus purpureus]